jgi:hypothetical protein
MPDHEYQLHQFRSYRNTRVGLSLGFIDPKAGGYVPALDEVLQFDGTTVVLKDGREFPNVPQLRGAVSEGWFVLVGDVAPEYRPRPAGIEVRDTEQRGQERVVKRTVTTVGDDERFVGNVESRRIAREQTNETAGRNVPLQTEAARQAVAEESRAIARSEELDPVVLDVLNVLDQASQQWEAAQIEPSEFEQADADIIALLNSVATSEAAVRPQPPVRRAVPAPTPESAPRPSARSLPLEREEHLRMPVVREDPTENAGTVVGTVTGRSGAVIEREKDFQLDLAPASPRAQSPAPTPRFGGTGVVVVDEERNLGGIALSNSRPPISLDDSAKVRPMSTDMVRTSGVEVGGRRKTAGESAPPSGIDGGVTVGRILSPTKFSVLATDANTSSTAIQRAEEGNPVKIEKFAEAASIATGDVEEARSGEELEELLPNAAQPPKVYRPEAEDPAYAAVRMMIPNFTWDRNRHVKDKVADALKHVKDPLFVKGILAVETEIVREEIKKALAALLKGNKPAAAAQPDQT